MIDFLNHHSVALVLISCGMNLFACAINLYQFYSRIRRPPK